MVYIHKGEQILCPGCHQVMVTALKDIEYGSPVNSDDFMPGLDMPRAGFPMICPECQTSYGSKGLPLVKRRPHVS